MYAVIRAGGKQYKVQAGDVLRLAKIEAELGSELQFTDVLMVGGDKTIIGSPVVKDAKVTVVVTRQAKSPKVIVFKKKRRQGYRKLQGHRQLYTEVFVKAITAEGQSSKAEKNAVVYDPAKKDERMLKVAEWREKNRQMGGRLEEGDVAPKEAKAKKAAPKKAAGAKKKPAKKKAGAKKAKSTAKKKSAK